MISLILFFLVSYSHVHPVYRTRSLARAELDPPVPLYPTVPDLDPGQMFPTVPDFEPGEEEDIYKTIKRSPKRKRAQKTLIDAVD